MRLAMAMALVMRPGDLLHQRVEYSPDSPNDAFFPFGDIARLLLQVKQVCGENFQRNRTDCDGIRGCRIAPSPAWVNVSG